MNSLHHIYSIPNLNRVHETRDTNNIPAIHIKRNYFKDSFFPSTISKWIKFDSKVRNSGSLSIFKKCLLNFIRPCANSIFNIHNPYGIKLLTRLHLSLSHLWDHKFRHCFQDTLNPLCDCSDDTETITLFFLRCPSSNAPTPREKCPNTGYFLVRIFPHSDCGKIRTRKYSVFRHFPTLLNKHS